MTAAARRLQFTARARLGVLTFSESIRAGLTQVRTSRRVANTRPKKTKTR